MIRNGQLDTTGSGIILYFSFCEKALFTCASCQDGRHNSFLAPCELELRNDFLKKKKIPKFEGSNFVIRFAAVVPRLSLLFFYFSKSLSLSPNSALNRCSCHGPKDFVAIGFG